MGARMSDYLDTHPGSSALKTDHMAAMYLSPRLRLSSCSKQSAVQKILQETMHELHFTYSLDARITDDGRRRG